MKILVIAATEAEIGLSIKHIASVAEEVNKHLFRLNGHEIQFAITGVGMVATAYNLTKILTTEKYDLAIQAGIAGSISRDINIGEVVVVAEEQFADLGAEDNGEFLNIFQLGLIDKNTMPFTNGTLVNRQIHGNIKLRQVQGITVNTVTGDDSTAQLKAHLYPEAAETMEGAAFHYICLLEHVKHIQLRGISNYVEKRDRKKWNIELAIANVNEYLLSYLHSLTC